MHPTMPAPPSNARTMSGWRIFTPLFDPQTPLDREGNMRPSRVEAGGKSEIYRHRQAVTVPGRNGEWL
jgi:hypothetical protein